MEKPTWKNTLYPQDKWYGNIFEMQKVAKEVQYPFFCWNDLIYQTSDTWLTKWTVRDL